MLTQERKAHLLKTLSRDGRLVAKDVSLELGVSEDTIRRDLRDLAGEGLLLRVHGGALPASPAVADLATRRDLSPEDKSAIGRTAARMVKPGQVVFLDGGTTALQVVRHLDPGLRATFVTHSPSVAVALAAHPGIEVDVIGGRLFRHSMVAIGCAAADAIARVHADLYFMGVTGIHPEFGLTTGDAEEAAIKRALSRQAGETVVLASREKLGTVSHFRVGMWTDVDVLVLESGLPEETIRPYRMDALTLTFA